ncbi:MAG: hypothetical protein IPM68_09310 [Flavobacteriales bacterium]|nr:hypothetical protein [Flavobacteriales bacterium]
MAAADVVAEQGVLHLQGALVALHHRHGKSGVGATVDALKFQLVRAAVEGLLRVVEQVQQQVPLASGEDAAHVGTALELGPQHRIHPDVHEGGHLLELVDGQEDGAALFVQDAEDLARCGGL